MDIRRILKSKLILQWGVLVLILSILLSFITISDAWFSPLFNHDPWSETDFTIEKVDDIYTENDTLPMDILFGTSKQLVRYTGEVRYDEISKINNGSVPYREDLETLYPNVTIKEIGDKQPEELIDPSTADFEPRLYMLSKARGVQAWKLFGDLVTAGIKALTRLLAKLDGLLINIKNISANSVLKALNLKGLLNIINKVFVKDEEGNWSIFFILALISFIFCLVGVAWRYITGKSKKQSFGNLIFALFIGLGLLFLSYTNATRVITLSDKLMLTVDNLITSTNQSGEGISGSTDTWWKVDIKDSESETLSVREISLLNRMMITVQLNAQFNGTDIRKDPGFYSRIRADLKTFSGTDGTTFGNLGEWFWVNNSTVAIGASKPEIQKNVLNMNRVPVKDVTFRLDGMLEALEKAYGSASTKEKKEIIQVYDAFANPSSWGTALEFILLQVIFVLLFICLWRFVLRILLGKMLAGAFWVGMPVAGVLYISGQEKLMKRGKMIAFIGLTSIIQVFVLSVVFDLVLLITGILVNSTDGELYGYLLVIAFLIFVLMNIKRIIVFLERLLDSINNSLSPELNRASKAFKAQAKRKLGEFNRWYDNRESDAFVEDGNGGVRKIKVKNRGNFISMFGHTLEEGFSESVNRDGLLKIGREGFKARRDAKTEALTAMAKQLQEENERKIQNLEDELKSLENTAYTNPDAETDEEKYEGLKDLQIAVGNNKEKLDELNNKQNIIRDKESDVLRLENEIKTLETKPFRDQTEEELLAKKKEELKVKTEELQNLKRDVLDEVDKAIAERFKEIRNMVERDDKTSLSQSLIFERNQIEEILKKGKNLSEEEIKKYAERLALIKKQINGVFNMDDNQALFVASLSTVEKLKAHNNALNTYETNKEYNKAVIDANNRATTAKEAEEAFEARQIAMEKAAAEEATRLKSERVKYEDRVSKAGQDFQNEVNGLIHKKAVEDATSDIEEKEKEIFEAKKAKLKAQLYDSAIMMGRGDTKGAIEQYEGVPMSVATEISKLYEEGGKYGQGTTKYGKILDGTHPLSKIGEAEREIKENIDDLMKDSKALNDLLMTQTKQEMESLTAEKVSSYEQDYRRTVENGLRMSEDGTVTGRDSIETTAKALKFIAEDLNGSQAVEKFSTSIINPEFKGEEQEFKPQFEDMNLREAISVALPHHVPTPQAQSMDAQSNIEGFNQRNREMVREVSTPEAERVPTPQVAYNNAEIENAIRRGMEKYSGGTGNNSQETLSTDELNKMVNSAILQMNEASQNGDNISPKDIQNMVEFWGKIPTEDDIRKAIMEEEAKLYANGGKVVIKDAKPDNSNTAEMRAMEERISNLEARPGTKSETVIREVSSGGEITSADIDAMLKEMNTGASTMPNNGELDALKKEVERLSAKEPTVERVETVVKETSTDNDTLKAMQSRIDEMEARAGATPKKATESSTSTETDAKMKALQDEVDGLKETSSKSTKVENSAEEKVKEKTQESINSDTKATNSSESAQPEKEDKKEKKPKKFFFK